MAATGKEVPQDTLPVQRLAGGQSTQGNDYHWANLKIRFTNCRVVTQGQRLSPANFNKVLLAFDSKSSTNVGIFPQRCKLTPELMENDTKMALKM